MLSISYRVRSVFVICVRRHTVSENRALSSHGIFIVSFPNDHPATRPIGNNPHWPRYLWLWCWPV